MSILNSVLEIVDVIRNPGWERLLYRCLSPMPFRHYRKRGEYLAEAIPKGLKKYVLFVDGEAVGQVEYSPAEASAYPISGSDVWVLNCIWVLRRAGGRGFGRVLMRRVLESVGDARVIATIALEGHPSPWFKLRHMEYLGFKSIDSRRMRHRVKHPEACFKTHLMWMPLAEGAEPPSMNWKALLRGVDFCIAHPLYRSERLGLEEIYENC
ncbi:MAG: hypothetical protein QW486_02340 [Candidatus Bathyarchaeia archaeon]